MRRSLLLLLLASLSFGQSSSGDLVSSWFPLHPGDKWIYAHENRDDEGGGREHPRIERWRTEEFVIGAWQIPEGTLVVKQNQVVGAPPRFTPQPPPLNAYFIRGDCIYLNYVAWVRTTHQLSDEYRKELNAGHISPDFCFPLAAGKTWGAPHWGGWRPAADAKDWRVLTPAVQNIFHIASTSSYPGSGDSVGIWFEKGVGIVRQETLHHGTYSETRMRLVHFDPATR